MPADSTTRATESRAILRLAFDCDNACVFCGQDGLVGAIEHTREQLEQLRETHDEISFVGGEPTLDPRLPQAIADARALGFAAVGVQTNARRLAAEPALFHALVEAGLSDLQLSIHGPTSESHDYHTSRAGSLEACIAVMQLAARASVTVVVKTVITRSNFRELVKLPPALKRRGVEAWLLEVVRPYGRAADHFARVVPRFGMALPWALHALEQARRHALSAWIRGAPVCALGPFAASELSSEVRHHAAPCQACAMRPRCPGIDAAYAEVFGHGELRPIEHAAAGNFDSGRRRLMRMFVGVGELVERPVQLYSPSEAEAEGEPAAEAVGAGKNRRLPILTDAPVGERQSRTDE